MPNANTIQFLNYHVQFVFQIPKVMFSNPSVQLFLYTSNHVHIFHAICNTQSRNHNHVAHNIKMYNACNALNPMPILFLGNYIPIS